MLLGQDHEGGGKPGEDFLVSWLELQSSLYTLDGRDDKLFKYLEEKKLEAEGRGGRRSRGGREEARPSTSTTTSSTTTTKTGGERQGHEEGGRGDGVISSKRQRRAEGEDDDADMDVEVVNEKVTLKAFLETAKQRLHLSRGSRPQEAEEFAVIFDFLKTSITSGLGP